MSGEVLPFSQSCENNKAFIVQHLLTLFAGRNQVLEIASGTGQHIETFARACPQLHWTPSDPDPRQRASIKARIRASKLENVEDPMDLDVTGVWPTLTVDSLIVANMLHISAQDTLPALCHGAADVIRPEGILHIYGPFKQSGKHTSESNAEFDRSLKARDAEWGIRELELVVDEACAQGFTLKEVIDMPANNFSIVFCRATAACQSQ